MFGAILGDIAGSRFEFSRPEKFNYRKEPFFTDRSFFTDDTVMTVATKYAVLNGTSYRTAYLQFGKMFPLVGYGTMFKRWLEGGGCAAYRSYGNGSAMRVSFIGEYFPTLERVCENAQQSALCTHNHPEGIKGAEAIAVCVYLARTGNSKKEIRKYIEKNYGYNLSKPLLLLRPRAKVDMSCQVSVPLAIRCFLESSSWESCMRNVYSVLCDTDTVGCIAGSIAEAFYHTTGQNDLELMRKYLAVPDSFGRCDMTLFNWATMN